ncbi:hypothetical protein [Corynebacterium vitaeruminis]|uniref:hypothetical protein n=1 Tax=Corynebacterium vitaeruminis TaxID=38305 RepID=UPI000660F044|nr:hypothetical protein [Corynebacterium vitaeruminis]
MTERCQHQPSSGSYQDAAQRTTKFINSPVRLGTAIGVTTAVIALLALLKAHIIGSIGWWIMIALLLVLIGATLFAHQAKTSTKETRPSYFTEPMRESPNDISWNSSVSVLLMFPGAWIIAAVAERISSTPVACIVTLVLAAITATCAILPRQFGFLPLAAQLPDNFAQHCPYPADSPEARILAVLATARLRDSYVFFTDQLPYFAMLDDDDVSAALHTLVADRRITIAKNNSALTEKGRAREFAQLTDTALAN